MIEREYDSFLLHFGDVRYEKLALLLHNVVTTANFFDISDDRSLVMLDQKDTSGINFSI